MSNNQHTNHVIPISQHPPFSSQTFSPSCGSTPTEQSECPRISLPISSSPPFNSDTSSSPSMSPEHSPDNSHQPQNLPLLLPQLDHSQTSVLSPIPAQSSPSHIRQHNERFPQHIFQHLYPERRSKRTRSSRQGNNIG
eukprot:TRINITY_DN1318_c0_g1_i1.p1 TRINITY_DN1318_c0_g1~~TRINITY_DN1318_c0_g1_i1.p1  ORF type:complete len:151 (+),score=5.74 TRINITY_DN1318_c0_g1_i1:41-454(+)